VVAMVNLLFFVRIPMWITICAAMIVGLVQGYTEN